MKIVRNVHEMASLRSPDVGFVPTMGAFHEGHLSLMREARSCHDSVTVSLFVNPLQFGRSEDLSRYPRQEERDFELAREAGVDIMFAPPADQIYRRDPSTLVRVSGLTEPWEGAFRPGHFDGVATVVCKLFNITAPKTAYFGWKDLQQCLVIQRMVEDLDMPVELSFQETVRETDGLALSSRNAYLSAEQRAQAPHLYATISSAKGEIMAGADVAESLNQARDHLDKRGFAVDYLEFVSKDDLRPLRDRGEGAVIVAAKLGKTRLIDNVRTYLH